jgi:predicted RND superfamily exporter protein
MRARIEQIFEEMARSLYRHPFATLSLVLLAVVLLVSQLPRIQVDTSTEGFLHPDDPALIRYDEFRAVFGRDEVILVAMGPTEVFELAFLEKLRALHDEIEADVPHIDEITSLINARETRGEASELIVGDLLETPPSTDAELESLRERVLAHPIYRNLLISEDGRFTTLVIRTNAYSDASETDPIEAGFDETSDDEPRVFLTDAENSETVAAVAAVLARHSQPDFPLLSAGSPVIMDAVKSSMMRDMRRFMAVAILTIGIFLYVMFRRISGVLMPLLVVVLSLLSTLSLMAIFGAAIKIPTQILPSFLLAVGVGDSVHILAIFYRHMERGESKEEAIAEAMGHSGLAVLMTSLTTAAGLASFSTAEIAPLADLGIYACFGALLALVFTLVLLPALVAVVPIRVRAGEVEDPREGAMDRLLGAIATIATRHARAIALSSFVLIALSVVAIAQLRFSHDPLIWLPADSEARQATELANRELNGSVSVEVLVDTRQENGLYEPAFLTALDEANRATARFEDEELFVGKVMSIVDILQEIHQALNENDPAYHVIPGDRLLVAQELLLFENAGSDDLEDVTDSLFQTARVTLKVPWVDAIHYNDFLDDLHDRYEATFSPDAGITVTGLLPLLARTLQAAISSAAKSYLIAGFVIGAMMILLVGSVRLGLISMIPNLLPILLVMGFMWVFALPLDLFTMMIGSIAIGLAVDDTVHFMHNFRRYYDETGDIEESVRRTLLGTGRAMMVTTVVLSIGFFTFMLASMNNLFNFGLLTGLAILIALLSDYFLAPALVKLLVRTPDPEAARGDG